VRTSVLTRWRSKLSGKLGGRRRGEVNVAHATDAVRVIVPTTPRPLSLVSGVELGGPSELASLRVRVNELERELSARDAERAERAAQTARRAERRAAQAASSHGSRRSSDDPSAWTLEGWLSSLRLGAIVADALRPEASGVDEFEYARTQLGGLLGQRLAAAQLEGLSDELIAAIDELRAQDVATGAQLSAKFESGEGAFELKYGSLETFSQGLDGAIGPATMHSAGSEPPSIRGQLEREHCAMPDATIPFATPQTKGVAKVLPMQQWLYVVDPERAQDDGTFTIDGRNREPLAFFEAKMDEKNCELSTRQLPTVDSDELASARLYTGPMYAKVRAA
jgi:hypothetical protein